MKEQRDGRGWKTLLALVIVFSAIATVAARYEDFHVTLLRIGDPAQQVSGDSTQLLERLLAGTYTNSSGLKVSSQTITNGQAVTLASGINLLLASGEAALGTNVITFNVVPAGQRSYLVNKSVVSNKIQWAAGGNYLGPLVLINTNEAAVIVAPLTNTLYGIE